MGPNFPVDGKNRWRIFKGCCHADSIWAVTIRGGREAVRLLDERAKTSARASAALNY